MKYGCPKRVNRKQNHGASPGKNVPPDMEILFSGKGKIKRFPKKIPFHSAALGSPAQ
jgi:hypothetical protein